MERIGNETNSFLFLFNFNLRILQITSTLFFKNNPRLFDINDKNLKPRNTKFVQVINFDSFRKSEIHKTNQTTKTDKNTPAAPVFLRQSSWFDRELERELFDLPRIPWKLSRLIRSRDRLVSVDRRKKKKAKLVRFSRGQDDG